MTKTSHNSSASTHSNAPLQDWTASEIAAAVNARTVKCEAVVRACLDHIETLEAKVMAWEYLNPDQVIAQARALDAAGVSGPLAGVPFGIKDIIDTADMPTQMGSPIYKGHRPKGDAACVALSRKAGAILLGKTVTTEFANRHPGKTHNPFDFTRTPGGSSSGSAAAVGIHMVPLAIGTQTTASTIRPASFCGAFGYRPTHGDLRCVGVKEASGTLDTLGLFARSVEDIALYREVLAGSTPVPIATPSAPLRVGFCRTHLWSQVEPHTQALIEDAAQQLARAGCKVEDVALPADFERVEDAHRWVSSFEFSRNFTWEIENHWTEISETLRNNRLKDGLSCTFDHYREARNLLAHCRGLLDPVFDQYDVLINAPATGEAPVGLNQTGNASVCVIWTSMHVPAMTLPLFKGPNNLPIGLQLIARRNNDRGLFSAARQIWQTLS